MKKIVVLPDADPLFRTLSLFLYSVERFLSVIAFSKFIDLLISKKTRESFLFISRRSRTMIRKRKDPGMKRIINEKNYGITLSWWMRSLPNIYHDGTVPIVRTNSPVVTNSPVINALSFRMNALRLLPVHCKLIGVQRKALWRHYAREKCPDTYQDLAFVRQHDLLVNPFEAVGILECSWIVVRAEYIDMLVVLRNHFLKIFQ